MSQFLKTENKFLFWDYLILAGIVSAILLESIYTIHQVGVSWDEPGYFKVAKGYGEWFKHLGRNSFQRSVLERTFEIKFLGNPHPSLSKLLGMSTYFLFRSFLGEFYAYRFYAPILFGLLLSLIYWRARRSWGRIAGISAVLCFGLMPRLFTDGHIGATETPLMFFWFLTTLLFEASFQKRWLLALAGIAYGLTMSVKFTGFLVLIPLLVWAGIFVRKKLLFSGAWMLLIGLGVFFLLQPSMWDEPVLDFLEFLQMSLFRQGKALIPVLFLGKYYEFSAPFYYAPVMTMITTPVMTLFFFFLGLARTLLHRFRDTVSGSSVIHFFFFMLMMVAPNAPSYDGVRLFDPAFIFLSLLAGYGFSGAVFWVANRFKKFSGLVKVFSFLLLGVGTLYPLFQVYPYGLEYYNELIGGVSGARRKGLETTYWWTVVNEKALKRLNQVLPANVSLVCWPTSADICSFYQELGMLRKDLKITRRKDFDYLLMLSRPYWNFEPFFASLGIPQSELEIIADQKLDGVPLWVLYQQRREKIEFPEKFAK